MKKEINTNFVNYDNIISITLENGVVVAIIYHEFGHAINAIISFTENALRLNETPRKKYLKFKEGGYYLEIALFGRVIKELSYGEVLYILNEDNYKKSLDDFRNGFMKLSNTDLRVKGQFKGLNLDNDSKLSGLKNSIFIKAKKGNNENDAYNNVKIYIPLRNDVIGRTITEDDLDAFL